MATRLPPIPDELLEARDKARMIRWLGNQDIPASFKARWLREWGAHTGVPVGKPDFDLVERYPAPEPNF